MLLTPTAINAQEHESIAKYRKGEVIVKFKSHVGIRKSASRGEAQGGEPFVGSQTVNTILKQMGAKEVKQLLPRSDKPRQNARGKFGSSAVPKDLTTLCLLKYDEAIGGSVETVLETLRQLEDVEYAEPNYIRKASSATYPTASRLDEQWGLKAINMPYLWQQPIINPKRPVIAIIDSGVDINHPDLKDNIWNNPNEEASGEDTDENGFVDDLHGWNFVDNSPVVTDDNKHGTHCAGIAAATGEGVVSGANPDALIMPVKVLNKKGDGDDATIIQGVEYAVANGADIISMSLGGIGFSKAFNEVFEKASDNAILFAAAGNNGMCIKSNHSGFHNSRNSSSPSFPAAFSSVIGVMATQDDGTLTSFSNYDCDGPLFSSSAHGNYELRAPGKSILSTVPDNKYSEMDGTSMACPMAAGAISRLLQCRNFSSKEEMLKTIVMASGGHIDMEAAYKAKIDILAQEAFEVTTDDGVTLFFVKNGENTVQLGNGTSPALSQQTAGDIEIPDFVHNYTVTGIAANAFYGCTDLRRAHLPTNLISIGASAFRECGVKDIFLNGDTPPQCADDAFDSEQKECIYLYVPTPFESYYKEKEPWNLFPKFSRNTNYKKGNVFYKDVNGVQTMFIVTDANLHQVSIGGFYCAASIDAAITGVYEIPTSVNGYDVTSIGCYAFTNCTNLTSVSIPDCVTYFDDYAFSGCSGLSSIKFPNSLTSLGEGVFEGCSRLSSVTIPSGTTSINDYSFYKCSGLTSITIPDGVTSIGNYAFADCSALTSVTIPDGVTSIGNYAFADCSALTSVIFSGDDVTSIGEKAFEDCSGIESIIIPSGVTSIGHRAFYRCSTLNSLVIPKSVTSIDTQAFYECTALTSVTSFIEDPFDAVVFWNYKNATLYVPSGTVDKYKKAEGWKLFKNIVEMGGETPEDIINFADGNVKAICVANWDTDGDGLLSKTEAAAVTSIGTVFKNSNITSFDELQYFTGLTEIEGRAFNNCQLTSVTIPNGVKTIGDAAFSQNEIASVSLPNTLESIGKYAFASNKLQSITIPQKVTTIEEGTFYNNELQSVSILGKVTAIGKDAFTYYQKITSFSISDLVSWCGMNADWYRDSNKGEKCSFYVNGHEVTDLVIPDGVTFIGKYTFMGLSGLTSLTIPEGVTSIQSSAFLGCIGLTSVTLPKSLTSIGDFVFQDSKGIATVTALMTEPFDFDPDASTFHYTIFDNAILYVPAGTKSLYKNAEGWKEFKNIVEMEDGSPNLNDGDVFTAVNADGVELTFKVISANDKTCQVGSGSIEGPRAIDKTYKGPITIPATANGFKVTSIGNFAFYDTQITYATISEGVENIGRGAFRCYSYLKTLELPSTIKSIGEQIIAYYLDEDWGSVLHNNVVSIVTHMTEPIDIPDNAFGFDTKYSDEEGYADNFCRAGTREMADDDDYVNGLNKIRATLYVPAGTLSKYKAIKGWTMFKEMKESMQGDANTDGKVGDEDVELVKEYIMTGKTEGLIFTNADANGDFEINTADIVRILNIINTAY